MVAQRGGSLQVVMGTGQKYSLSRDVAARYEDRSIGQALEAICAEEIHDPELRGMLAASDTVLELYSEDTRGNAVEEPVSRFDAWRRIMRRLEENETVELDMARSHKGGRPAVGTP